MVVTQYGGNLRRPRIRVVEVPGCRLSPGVTGSDRSDCLPCNRSDQGYLSGVQEGICGTAEGSSDVERDNQFPLRASISGANDVHDEERRLGRIRNHRTARDVK